MLKNGKQSGFSLIELMIVVAVIAILTAIAYPTYTQYKVRVNRADMQTEMMRIAERLQNYKAVNYIFTNATLSGVGGASAYPNSTPVFDLTLTTTAQAWILTAAPKSGTIQDGNGAIVLNNQGQKCWTKTTTACTPTATSNWDGK